MPARQMDMQWISIPSCIFVLHVWSLCSNAMAEVHLLSRKPGYHDLRMQSTMTRCLYRLGDICNHIRSRHHGQSGHIRHGSLHKPLPKLPVRQHEWVLVETSLAPWNADRAAPDVDECRSIGSDRDSAIGHALSALDLTNTEQTHRNVVWQPAVTHATHVVQPYEITRQAVDREVHHYHHLHRTLPVTDFQILPARHFIENSRGSYTEVSGENKPLDTDDETELLRVIDNSASKQARAEMERVEAEPTPTPRKERGTPYPGKDGQLNHYLHHPAHATVQDSAKAVRAPVHNESRTAPTFWQTRSLPNEDDRDSDEVHPITRVESRRNAMNRSGAPASEAPIAVALQTGESKQSTQHQRHDSYPLPPKHMASRKTHFFEFDATPSRPLARGSMQAVYDVRHQATDVNVPSDNSISLSSESAVDERRVLRTEQERRPTSESLSTGEQLSDRLNNARPPLLAGAMGTARAKASGLTRSAESAPSLARASPELLLDYEHSCPSCGAPKLIRSPTTSGSRAASPSDKQPIPAARDVSGNMSRLPRPASTRVAFELPEPGTRASTFVSQKPSAAPNEGPVATTRVQSTTTSFLPAAYARAAERGVLPSAHAAAAGTSSQPKPASQGIYLNYSNFRLSEEVRHRPRR